LTIAPDQYCVTPDASVDGAHSTVSVVSVADTPRNPDGTLGGVVSAAQLAGASNAAHTSVAPIVMASRLARPPRMLNLPRLGENASV